MLPTWPVSCCISSDMVFKSLPHTNTKPFRSDSVQAYPILGSQALSKFSSMMDITADPKQAASPFDDALIADFPLILFWTKIGLSGSLLSLSAFVIVALALKSHYSLMGTSLYHLNVFCFTTNLMSFIRVSSPQTTFFDSLFFFLSLYSFFLSSNSTYLSLCSSPFSSLPTASWHCLAFSHY